MSHSTALGQKRQIGLLRTQFAQGDGLPFAEVLPAERVEKSLHEAGAAWRDCVYTPLLTVWAFLSQVISADSSCRATVARVLSWLVSKNETLCSAETGPYCKARRRLPEKLLVRLARETGQTLHGKAPTEWRWKGRCVKIVDGTTVSMPDTPANQMEYPQTSSQKPGLGFPIARMVVVFCLATGSVLNAALGRYEGKRTGETALLRTLEEGLDRGDVLLADRGFCGYFAIARWQERGIDVVTRLHQRRHYDLRRGARLGPNDHIVRWTKPRQRPEWMDADQHARLPEELYLREVRVRIDQRGFRTKQVVVVTTLCDFDEYSVSDLAALYRARWHAELDLRSLKTTLGMDILRCKTPAMVRKEVWAHLLAYNLIRTVMAQAASVHDVLPRTISFKGALQTIQAFADRLREAAGKTESELQSELMIAVVAHAVGNRPDRIEPRARKRRPKEYDLLTVPREVARRQLLQST